MKILLTGEPKSGKTTLIAKLLEKQSYKQGFVTKEVRVNDERVGFELVNADGERAILASTSVVSQHKVSRYFVDLKGLDIFIEPLFSYSKGQLLYIDEVGQMELFSERFKELVTTYLDSGNNFVGTITSIYSDGFVKKIKARKDIKIIEVTPKNRDQLSEELQF